MGLKGCFPVSVENLGLGACCKQVLITCNACSCTYWFEVGGSCRNFVGLLTCNACLSKAGLSILVDRWEVLYEIDMGFRV